jgi:hypothetical protein
MSELIEKLEALIDKAKRAHFSCEDRYYSCPKSVDGCSNEGYEEDECNCGADEHSASVDVLVDQINELI